jgi:diadenosine tetraphosphate (Ap4A) HIT family hydrolase
VSHEVRKTAIHKIVEACRDGTDEALIKRMSSGWAVMGRLQFLRGYCLLLPDPVVPHLNAMDIAVRTQFLADMAKLGDAVLAGTNALRINYAMFGNVEPALHAHVIPRFNDEVESMRTAHPWAYDWAAAPQFDLATHGGLLNEIRNRIA